MKLKEIYRGDVWEGHYGVCREVMDLTPAGEVATKNLRTGAVFCWARCLNSEWIFYKLISRFATANLSSAIKDFKAASFGPPVTCAYCGESFESPGPRPYPLVCPQCQGKPSKIDTVEDGQVWRNKGRDVVRQITAVVRNSNGSVLQYATQRMDDGTTSWWYRGTEAGDTEVLGKLLGMLKEHK